MTGAFGIEDVAVDSSEAGSVAETEVAAGVECVVEEDLARSKRTVEA